MDVFQDTECDYTNIARETVTSASTPAAPFHAASSSTPSQQHYQYPHQYQVINTTSISSPDAAAAAAAALLSYAPSTTNTDGATSSSPTSQEQINLHPMETFYGQITSTMDALTIFQSCRLGILPQVERRLQDSERSEIRSGSVFVFDENQSGIKRWTDGRLWSPSRIQGNFLVYKEVEKKLPKKQDKSTKREIQKLERLGYMDGKRGATGSKGTYVYKRDGLTKKTISVSLPNRVTLHLIAYYDTDDIDLGRLYPPVAYEELKNIVIPHELLAQNFRKPVLENDGAGAGVGAGVGVGGNNNNDLFNELDFGLLATANDLGNGNGGYFAPQPMTSTTMISNSENIAFLEQLGIHPQGFSQFMDNNGVNYFGTGSSSGSESQNVATTSTTTPANGRYNLRQRDPQPFEPTPEETNPIVMTATTTTYYAPLPDWYYQESSANEPETETETETETENETMNTNDNGFLNGLLLLSDVAIDRYSSDMGLEETDQTATETEDEGTEMETSPSTTSIPDMMFSSGEVDCEEEGNANGNLKMLSSVCVSSEGLLSN